VSRVAASAGYDQQPAYYDETSGGRVYLATGQTPAPRPTPPPVAGPQPELPKLVYSPWAKYCGKGQDGKDVCFTGKDGRTEAGQPIIAAALIETKGEAKKLFRITVPSPLQLQFGTRLIIDGDPPVSGAFFTCYANGCMADYEVTPELVARLKSGQRLEVQAINLAAKAISFPLPLSDASGNSFRTASEAFPTIDPAGFKELQTKQRPDMRTPGDTAAGQLPRLVYSPWTKFCGKGQDPNAKETCFTGKDGRTEAGQPVVAAALIEPTGEPKKLLRVTLPSPLQLQYGIRLIIDGDPPIAAAFFTCFANGCMADYEATPELVAKLKSGRNMQIQAINLASTQVAFPLPLADSTGNSFRAAYDGPATDPKVYEEMQKKLQEDLQKRAEEMRKRGGAK
jgi:invasion protein IalB